MDHFITIFFPLYKQSWSLLMESIQNSLGFSFLYFFFSFLPLPPFLLSPFPPSFLPSHFPSFTSFLSFLFPFLFVCFILVFPFLVRHLPYAIIYYYWQSWRIKSVSLIRDNCRVHFRWTKRWKLYSTEDQSFWKKRKHCVQEL